MYFARRPNSLDDFSYVRAVERRTRRRDVAAFATTGGDARVMTQINRTIGQFPTVDKVVILDPGRNCFGDRSGENRCYKDLPEGQRP